MVLVAIPFNFYSSLPVHLLTDKIVVDVSNRNKVRRAESEESQAEMLARLLPASRVVKSFNVLSAYSLGKFKLNVNVTERDNESELLLFIEQIRNNILTFSNGNIAPAATSN